jgi:hypothetical protein
MQDAGAAAVDQTEFTLVRKRKILGSRSPRSESPQSVEDNAGVTVLEDSQATVGGDLSNEPEGQTMAGNELDDAAGSAATQSSSQASEAAPAASKRARVAIDPAVTKPRPSFAAAAGAAAQTSSLAGDAVGRRAAESPSVRHGNETLSSTESPASGQSASGQKRAPTSAGGRSAASAAESPSSPRSGQLTTRNSSTIVAETPLGNSRTSDRRSFSQFTAAQREELDEIDEAQGSAESAASAGGIFVDSQRNRNRVATYRDLLAADLSHNPVLNAKRWELEDRLRRIEDSRGQDVEETLEIYERDFNIQCVLSTDACPTRLW